MSYFVEDLLESIKLRSMAPIAQSTFDDDKLLALANEEMQLKLVSDLVAVREDFFLSEEEVTIEANVANYGIPERAIGNALKQVFWFPNNSTTPVVLSRVDSEASAYVDTTSQDPRAFYFLGDEIILLPTPTTAAGTLKFVFPSVPNALALTTTCAEITGTSDDGTTASFTVDTDLTSTLNVGDEVDFLCTKSPFKLWSYKVPITQITSTQIDVDLSNVVSGSGALLPQSGDYICPTGTSNIPQIPVAFHPVLAQMVVVRLMESLGDLNKMGAAKGTLQEMRTEAMKLIRNRVENSPDKVTTRVSLSRYFR